MTAPRIVVGAGLSAMLALVALASGGCDAELVPDPDEPRRPPPPPRGGWAAADARAARAAGASDRSCHTSRMATFPGFMSRSTMTP